VQVSDFLIENYYNLFGRSACILPSRRTVLRGLCRCAVSIHPSLRPLHAGIVG